MDTPRCHASACSARQAWQHRYYSGAVSVTLRLRSKAVTTTQNGVLPPTGTKPCAFDWDASGVQFGLE